MLNTTGLVARRVLVRPRAGAGAAWGPTSWRSFSTEPAVAEPAAAEPPALATIAASLRCPLTEEGTRKCRKLRENNWVPSLLYGKDADGVNHDPVLLKMEWFEANRLVCKYGETLENQAFELTVGDETHTVIPRNVCLNPVTDKVIGMNFLRYRAGLKVNMPFMFVNEEVCVPLKRGAHLVVVRPTVKCTTSSKHIPRALEVDLAGAKHKEVIRLDRATIPDTLTLLIDEEEQEEYTIASIMGSARG